MTAATTDNILVLPSGKVADLSKTQFGIIYSIDGPPDDFHASPFMFGKRLGEWEGEDAPDTVDEYGTTWYFTDRGESEMRYLASQGAGEVWEDAIEVKACALLDDDGFDAFVASECLCGTEATMGSLGAPMPDNEFNYGWVPAFGMNDGGGEQFGFVSAYVTPYMHDTDGKGLTELDENDWDAVVEAVASRYSL